jgi:uncharacterized protein YegJ (DUF2314 family)
MHRLNQTLLATLLAASCGLSQAQPADAASSPSPSPASSAASTTAPATPTPEDDAKMLRADPTEDPMDAQMPPDMPDSDPKMQAAIKQGKATLKKFLPLAKKNKDPNLMVFAVKVRFVDGKTVEHMWVTPFEFKGPGKFSGRLNDIPRAVKNVQHEQQINFTTKDIADWMYYDQSQHKMYGNYTTCARLTLGRDKDVADVKRIFGLDCTNHEM